MRVIYEGLRVRQNVFIPDFQRSCLAPEGAFSVRFITQFSRAFSPDEIRIYTSFSLLHSGTMIIAIV
jgi:hypothetical protein